MKKLTPQTMTFPQPNSIYLQAPDKYYTFPCEKSYYINTVTMDTVEGYKEFREQKKEILYSRMDDTMIEKLRDIRKKTGISVSEIIREAVRRLLSDVDANGSIKLHVGD